MLSKKYQRWQEKCKPVLELYSWKRVSEVNYKTDLYFITKKLDVYFLATFDTF